MTIIRIYRNHYLTWSPQALADINKDHLLNQEAWDWLSGLADASATHVAVCTVDGAFAGFFRFSINKPLLVAQGTFVVRRFRCSGIAKSLWRQVIAKMKPKRIEVDTVSWGGNRLILGLEQEFPSLIWCGFRKRRAHQSLRMDP